MCDDDNSTITYPANKNSAFTTRLNSSTTYRPSNIERTELSCTANVSTGTTAPSSEKPVSTDNNHLLRSVVNRSTSNTTVKPTAKTISGASA